MPGLPEHAGHDCRGFLDQPLDIRVAFHSLCVGISAERAEPLRESFLIFRLDVLVPEIDHFVAEQGGFDFLELPVRHVGDIDAPDFRPHGAGQGDRADLPAAVGFIVVMGRRVEPHYRSPCFTP